LNGLCAKAHPFAFAGEKSEKINNLLNIKIIKIKKHENIRAKSHRLSRDGTILCFCLILAVTGQPGKVYFLPTDKFLLSAPR